MIKRKKAANPSVRSKTSSKPITCVLFVTEAARKRFRALRDSSESFVCVSCCLKTQTEEIRVLRDDVKLLKDDFSKLESQSTIPPMLLVFPLAFPDHYPTVLTKSLRSIITLHNPHWLHHLL